MLLARCKVAGRCLILSAIADQKETQTTLPKIGSFEGLSGCIDDLLTAKRNANRRERYVKSLGYYLRQFAKGREQTAISDFTFSHVEDWISRYPAAVTRQTWLNRLSTLFTFAVRRGLIVANPCDRIERVTVDPKPPLILTPGQSRALLAATPTVMKPYVVLGMFAGIRPEEITRLDWSQINLAAGWSHWNRLRWLRCGNILCNAAQLRRRTPPLTAGGIRRGLCLACLAGRKTCCATRRRHICSPCIRTPPRWHCGSVTAKRF